MSTRGGTSSAASPAARTASPGTRSPVIKIAGLQDVVPQVLVPFERVTDLKNGKKRTSSISKLYPGYLMVQADIDDRGGSALASQAVRSTLRRGGRPARVPRQRAVRPRRSRRQEVSQHPLTHVGLRGASPQVSIGMQKGDLVKIKSGCLRRVRRNRRRSQPGTKERCKRHRDHLRPSDPRRTRILGSRNRLGRPRTRGIRSWRRKSPRIIKLQCPAGQATPAPPVGPALGAHGAEHRGLRQAVQRPHA